VLPVRLWVAGNKDGLGTGHEIETGNQLPAEASTREQISAWFQSIPGISITVFPPEGIGSGGPVPTAGGDG